MNHKYNFKLTAGHVGPNGHDAPVLQLVRVGLSWADSIEVTFNWVNTSSNSISAIMGIQLSLKSILSYYEIYKFTMTILFTGTEENKGF